MWRLIAGLAASAAAMVGLTPARAQTAAPPTVQVVGAGCPALTLAESRLNLQRARAAVGAGNLRILAIGSSSIEGAGASRPDLNFVARVEAELQQRLPGVDIVIVNRGIGGETTEGAARRMTQEIGAAMPDLILWQLGTNDVLQGRTIEAFLADFWIGVDAVAGSGADLVLIDPQRLPDDTLNPAFMGRNVTLEEVAALIGRQGERLGLPVAQRFVPMSGWAIPRRGVGPDDLHLNDEGYACWARQTAQQLAPLLRP